MYRLILCLTFGLWLGKAEAQNYFLRYVNTASGAITFVGNTLGLAKQTGQDLPGYYDSVGGFITVDTNQEAATFPPGTTFNWTNNSSAALLTMPTNSTVLYAELIWSGSAQNGSNTTAAGDVMPYVNNAVKFTLPNGTVNMISPDPTTAAFTTNPAPLLPAIFYIRSANVTALVQGAGAGYYTVGSVPGTLLPTDDNNNACGWTLAVVYGNPALHERNLSLFVGNSIAIAGAAPPNPASVSGFCAPPTGPVNARLYVSAIEGDANKSGDQMLFGTSTNTLLVLSGPNNLPQNFFGSQINDDNGLLDTNGTFGLSNSIPSSFSVAYCARQGWDITSVDVSAGLTNGANSAYAQNITSNDGYTVNALGLQIDVGSPVLTSVQSVDKASTFVGDTLTYTVTVTNSGTADAINLTFSDPLPYGTTYITNTFATNGVVIPTADPQNGVFVPLIQESNTMTFTYKVVVNQIPASAKFVTAATINFQSTGPCSQSPVINSTIVNVNVETLAPLLHITKTSTQTNVVPGGYMTYTISIPNFGTTNDYDCSLVDPLPDGVTYVPNTTTLNGSSVSDISGGEMPFSVKTAINGPGRPTGIIDVGDTVTVSFLVQVSTNPPPYINNVATFYDRGPAEDVSSVIPPIYADLAAGITAGPSPVSAGSPLTYTLTVTNLGPDSGTLLYDYVTLQLPFSQYFLSPVYTPSVGTFNPSNGVWSGINLPSNSVISMTISGEVSPAITTSNIIASVTVVPSLGTIDPFLSNNTATNSTPVQDVADLAVTISDGQTNVYTGQVLTYTITAINFGPSTLNTIYLSNSISPLLQNVSLFPTEGTYNSFNGVWNGLNLAAGDSVTMTLQGTVPTGAVGSVITNAVTVADPAGYTDPVLTNNYAINENTIIGAPILGVSKTAPTNVFAGTNFTYTISVTNSGAGVASNLVVYDTLPAGVSFQSAVGGPGVVNLNGSQVSWSLPSLAAGNSAGFNLTVTASAAGSLAVTNLATVTGTGPGTNVVTNASPPVVTYITPLADLAVGKAGPATTLAGANLSYTLSVTNFGPSMATNVVLVDPLPAGVTFVSATGGGATNGQGQAVWPLGTLAAGSVVSLNLTVLVPGNATILTNIASIGSPTLDPVPGNNTNPPVITPVIGQADLALFKSSPSNVLAGSTFNYTLTVTNAGPSAATNVSVTDPLPAGLTFVSATAGGVTNLPGQVVWTGLGTMAAYSATNLTLTVQAGGNMTGLTNVASVSSPTPDPYPPNNTNTPCITPLTPEADLSLIKTSPSNVLAGSTFNYSLIVSNAGPSAATNVTVSDPLPAGLTFVSATSGGATNSGQVVWTGLGTIAANATTNLTLTVQVAGNVTGLTNVAVVSSPTPDPYPPNNTNPPCITPVTPQADLSLMKSSPTNVLAGSIFNYSLIVSNAGPSAATNVTVADPLPAGLTFVSATSGGVTNLPGQVVWNGLGTIAANTATNLTLTVQVAGNVTGLTNVAVVSSPTPDPYPPNNTNPPCITPVTPQAALSVIKTSQTNVTAGSMFNYFIYVTNAGPSDAAGVIVTDALPAGLTFVSATSGGAVNGLGQVVWNGLGTIPANTAINLTLTVQVGGSVSGVTNVASAYSPTPDPIPTNTISPPCITPVIPEADLSLTKTSPSNVLAGSTFNYSLTVSNAGPSAATNVTVSDPLPTGLTFVSATFGGTTNLAGQVVWTGLGTIAANTTTNLTLTVQVAGNATGLTNVAAVNSPTPDPYPPNNTNPPCITPVIPEADLSLIKSSPTNVLAGSTFNYSLTVSNAGPSAATNVSVADSLPAGLTFVSATSGGTTNLPGQVVWNGLGTIAANTATNLTLTVQVGGYVTGLTNLAVVSSPTPDPYPPNNTNPPCITPVTPEADLALIKTSQPNVTAGSTFNYFLTVTNAGPSAATNVTVSDPLPAGLTFVSATSGGTTNLPGQVVWTGLGTIAANSTTNLTLTVQVGGNVTGLTNVATVSSPTPDPYPPNNTNTPCVTPLTPEADLSLIKTSPSNVLAGSTFNYSLTVSNAGPSAATNVTVSDPLPAGLTFVSATSGGVTNSGQVVWTGLGTIAANTTTNLTLTVQVAGNVTGLTNVAVVGSPTPDPYPPNNTNPPCITPVTPQAALSVFKTSQTNVTAGSTFNYFIYVTNAGPSDAAGVIVTDALPTGLTFVSATSGGAVNGLGQVVWNGLGTIPANTAVNLTLTVQVGGSVTGVTNVASAYSPTPNPNPTNTISPPCVNPVTPEADLSLTKSSPTNVLAGSTFNYSLTVSNAGPSAATNVTVADPLPAGVTFVSATSGGTTNLPGQVVWTGLGTIAANTTTNLTLTVQVAGNVTSLTNVAVASSPTPDPYPPNNTNPPCITPVTPQAALSVIKTSQTNVLAGSTFNYYIYVTNAGPSDASGVIVTDALPAGLTFVSATSGGAVNGLGQVVWNGLGAIPANTATNLTLTVQVGGSVTGLTNVASAYSPTPNPNPTNTISPPCVNPVTPEADLSLTKSSPTNVLAGSTFNYSITVSNAGPSSATNVVVADPLPAGLTFVSATSGGTTNLPGQVVWTGLGTIAANTATNLTLTVQVGGSVTGLTNLAVVSSPTPDPYPPNNTNPPCITPVTAQADLSLMKSSPSNVLAGSTFNYSITVSNAGPSAATNVVVADPLPAGLTFVSATSGGVTNLPGQVVWTGLGTIVANSTTNLTLTVQVAGNVTGLTNLAVVSSPTPDPYPPNNTNPPCVNPVTPEADLSLTKSSPTNVLAGSMFNYSITVSNAGPSSATNVVVADPLPAGLTFVSATSGGVTNLPGQVVWTGLGIIAANTATNLTLTVQVAGNVTGLTNLAVVSSPTPDPYPPNNTNPPCITPVTPQAALSVIKTSQTNVLAGSTFNYYIYITNAGPSDASGVIVTDALPVGLTFVSATSGGAVNGLGQVVWNGLGTIAANTATNLTLMVQAGGSVTGVTNVASVYSPTPNPNPTNTISPPCVNPVTPEADLSLTKSSPTNVLAGSTFNYSITVSNAGPSSATNVVVADPLPAGLTFVSATSGGTTNLPGQVVWTGLGTIAANTATNLTLTVQVAGNVTGLTNLAVVSSPTPDPYPPNNTNPPCITPVTAQAALSVIKTSQTNVTAGSTFNYYIYVTNAGPSDASGVIVTDALPAGLTFVSATSGGAVNGLGQVVWNGLGTIAANSATNLTLTVQAGGSVTGVTNVASVYSPTPNPNPTNTISPPCVNPVTPEADLSLTKSSPTNVLAGSTFNYSITVSNAGPSAATNVVVADPLPAGLMFVSATSGGTTNLPGLVVWTGLGAIAANTTTNLTLTVQVGGNVTGLTNVAAVYSPTPDPYPPNNTNPPCITPVTAQAALSVIKTSQTNVTAGSTFNYYIYVTNAGPSAASSVTVTDALPAGLTFVSATSGGVLNGLGQVVWSGLGTIAANTATNLTLTVQVGGSLTSLTNVASASSPTPNPSPTNTISPPCITPVSPVADVVVFVSGPATGVVTSNLTYTITVSNAGPSAAASVVSLDTLPPGTTYISSSGGGTLSNNVVYWPAVGTLPVGNTTTYTITLAPQNPGVITNVAAAGSTTYDPNLANNNGSSPGSWGITSVTGLADVAVFKTGTVTVNGGGTATYTIIATNYGPSTASNVVVKDILPVGATLQTAPGSSSISGGVVTWSGVSLAPNASATYTLTLTAGSAGTMTNIALSTSSTADPNTNNNNGSLPQSQAVTTVLNPPADVYVLLTGPTNVLVGTNFTYTIAVTNSGPNTASNVVVQDTLPSLVTFVSSTGGGGLSSGVYTWPSIPVLAAGSGVSYTITAYASTVSVFTNVASSTASTYDPNLANNNGSSASSQAVTYATQVHLIPQNLSITVGPNNFNPQTSLYQELVVVTNVGSATATAVQLTVAGLPSYVSLYNASGTNSSGVPYVQNNFPLPPGGQIDFVLEFYDSLRKPFTNIVSAFEVNASPVTAIPTNATPVAITTIFQSHINLYGNVDLTGVPFYVVEFPTVIGHSYTILYTESLNPAQWFVVTPYINANTTAVQWYDDGPPKTQSQPGSVNMRYYRAIEVK